MHRIREGLPLNRYHRPTFYLPNYPHDIEVGYTDYPTFDQVLEKLGLDKEVNLEEEVKKKILEASQELKYPLITQEDIGVSASSAARGEKAAAEAKAD